MLGKRGPFSREHAPEEFGDLQPLCSVQTLRKEEYAIHSPTNTYVQEYTEYIHMYLRSNPYSVIIYNIKNKDEGEVIER